MRSGGSVLKALSAAEGALPREHRPQAGYTERYREHRPQNQPDILSLCETEL